MRCHFRFLAVLPAFGLAGCLLTPDGLDAERDAAAAQGAPYAQPAAERVLPELPSPASDREVLQHAFLANGDLEAAWHAWRSSLASVEVESAWPQGMFEVEVERAFAGGSSTFDQTSVVGMFTPILEWPSKPRERGEIALATGRAARERFRGQALELRAQVLSATTRIRALREEQALQAEQLVLLGLESGSAGRAVGAGALQRGLVRIQLEVRLADDRLGRSVAELERERAALNGLLGRSPAAVIVLAAEAEPRALPGSEDELLAQLAARNAELAVLAREVEGRAGAVEIARLAYVPDLSPRLGFVGSVEQFLGASIGLPANLPAIRASIERARADLTSLEASARQRRSSLAAELAAEFVVLRDAERALRLFADDIVPIAQRLSESTRTSYASGGATQREWIESQRAEIDARVALVQARAARAVALVRIEWIAGTEIAELAGMQEVALGTP